MSGCIKTVFRLRYFQSYVFLECNPSIHSDIVPPSLRAPTKITPNIKPRNGYAKRIIALFVGGVPPSLQRSSDDGGAAVNGIDRRVVAIHLSNRPSKRKRALPLSNAQPHQVKLVSPRPFARRPLSHMAQEGCPVHVLMVLLCMIHKHQVQNKD